MHVVGNPFKYNKGCNTLRHLNAFNQINHLHAYMLFNQNVHCYVNTAPSKGIKEDKGQCFSFVLLSLTGRKREHIQIQNGYRRRRIKTSKGAYLLAMWKKFCKTSTFATAYEDSTSQYLEMFKMPSNIRKRRQFQVMKETVIFELQERDVIQIRLELVYRNDRRKIY